MSKESKVLQGIERVHDIRYICFRLKTLAENNEPLKDGVTLNGKKYSKTTLNKIKKEVEMLDNFGGWENFNVTWDVFWVGLDVRYAVWVTSRHNSPVRKLMHPVTLVKKANGRVVQEAVHQVRVQGVEVPRHILREREKILNDPELSKQLEKDEEVTEFLSGDISAKISRQMERDHLEKRLKELDD